MELDEDVLWAPIEQNAIVTVEGLAEKLNSSHFTAPLVTKILEKLANADNTLIKVEFEPSSAKLSLHSQMSHYKPQTLYYIVSQRGLRGKTFGGTPWELRSP